MFISKKSMKFVAILSAMILCVSCFAGCGNKAKDKNENGQTIFSVGQWPSQEGTDLDNWNARKAKFEEANPDFEVIPDNWTFDLKSFYAKAEAKTLPTLYNCYFTEMPQIIDMGYSSKLTKAFEESGLKEKFNPKIIEAVTDDNGDIYGFPYNAYVLGLVYNVDLFEKAGLMNEDGTPKQPKDWNELVEFALQIKEKTGKAGFILPTMNNYGGWISMPLFWSYGVDFMEMDKDGNWKATFDTQETVNALQFIKDLKWKYDIVPVNTLVDNGEYYKTYGIGEAAMLIGGAGTNDQARLYGMNPDDFGMMAMPKGPARHVTLLGGNIYCVANNATDDQIDGVLKWIGTQHTYEATDTFKENAEKSAKYAVEVNKALGVKTMSVWADNTESVNYQDEMIIKYANADLNHVKLYNDFLSSDVEIQAEEPVCAQELYDTIDKCIQQVWSDENADCAEIIKKACADFQKNYLDSLNF